MKRKIVKSVLALSLILALPLSAAQAATDIEASASSDYRRADLNAIPSKDALTRKVNISGNLSVEKFSDGRIKGLTNASSLSEPQKEAVLETMNFTDVEIKKMPEKLKEDLISAGGIKVDLETTSRHTYHSLDGQKYEITVDNKSEIDKLMQSDLDNYYNQSTFQSESKSISVMASDSKDRVEDGDFVGWNAMMYSGKTSDALEYKYTYVTYFDWNNYPFWMYTDKVAQQWDVKATRTNVGSYNVRNLNVGSVYGTSAEFNFYIGTPPYNPYLLNDVVIPVTNKGLRATFSSGYYHSWASVIPSVSIGPIGISWSALMGEDWSWYSTFKVGESWLEN